MSQTVRRPVLRAVFVMTLLPGCGGTGGCPDSLGWYDVSAARPGPIRVEIVANGAAVSLRVQDRGPYQLPDALRAAGDALAEDRRRPLLLVAYQKGIDTDPAVASFTELARRFDVHAFAQLPYGKVPALPNGAKCIHRASAGSSCPTPQRLRIRAVIEEEPVAGSDRANVVQPGRAPAH